MDTPNKSPLPQRNPKTHAEDRREVFWQITIPFALGILVLLAAAGAIIFSATQPVTDLERWADVSLMWMILPSLFFAFIILVFMIGFVYGISFLLRLIPRYALVVQLYFEKGKNKVSQLSNLISEPIIRVSSIWAAARRAVRIRNKKVQE